MKKAITRKQAERIANKTGYPLTENDGRTFYATNEEESGVWEYDSKKERDEAVERSKLGKILGKKLNIRRQ